MKLKKIKNFQNNKGHKLEIQKNEDLYSNILNQRDQHEILTAMHKFRGMRQKREGIAPVTTHSSQLNTHASMEKKDTTNN